MANSRYLEVVMDSSCVITAQAYLFLFHRVSLERLGVTYKKHRSQVYTETMRFCARSNPWFFDYLLEQARHFKPSASAPSVSALRDHAVYFFPCAVIDHLDRLFEETRDEQQFEGDVLVTRHTLAMGGHDIADCTNPVHSIGANQPQNQV